MRFKFLVFIVLFLSSHFSFSSEKNPVKNIKNYYDILSIQDHRSDREDKLLKALDSKDNVEIHLAIKAMGRIQDPKYIEKISHFLNHGKRFIRRATAMSLGLMPDSKAALPMIERLKIEDKNDVIANLLLSIGMVGDRTVIGVLEKEILKTNSKKVLEKAVQGLGLIYRKYRVKSINENVVAKIIDLLTHRKGVSISASFFLFMYADNFDKGQTSDFLNTFMKIRNKEAMALSCRALRKINNEISKNLIIELLNHKNLNVRIEAARALSGIELVNSEIKIILERLNKAENSGFAVQLLRSLSTLKEKAKSHRRDIWFTFTQSESEWVKSEALQTLSHIDSQFVQTQIIKDLNSNDEWSIRRSLRSLTNIEMTQDLANRVIEIARMNTEISMEALDYISTLRDISLFGDLEKVLKKIINEGPQDQVGVTARIIGKFKIKSLSKDLVKFISSNPKNFFGRLMALNALEKVGESDEVDSLKDVLKDPNKQIVEAAAKLFKIVKGEDYSHLIPVNHRIENDPMPSQKELLRAIFSVVKIETTRGLVYLSMHPIAPVTAAKFLRVVRSGKYDGTEFHRVVPHFVAQGGGKTGYGEQDYMIRDEVSSYNHHRGKVGIATAGKDTGSTQFFINHGSNMHLLGSYTMFADVIKGMKVVDNIEEGDKIISASVIFPMSEN